MFDTEDIYWRQSSRRHSRIKLSDLSDYFRCVANQLYLDKSVGYNNQGLKHVKLTISQTLNI